jgi:hypothetical protein
MIFGIWAVGLFIPTPTAQASFLYALFFAITRTAYIRTTVHAHSDCLNSHFIGVLCTLNEMTPQQNDEMQIIPEEREDDRFITVKRVHTLSKTSKPGEMRTEAFPCHLHWFPRSGVAGRMVPSSSHSLLPCALLFQLFLFPLWFVHEVDGVSSAAKERPRLDARFRASYCATLCCIVVILFLFDNNCPNID